MSVGADERAEGNSDRHHGWCAARDASSVPLAIGPRGLLWWQGEAAWGVRAPASSAMVARVKVLRVEGWWAGRGQAGSSEGRPEGSLARALRAKARAPAHRREEAVLCVKTSKGCEVESFPVKDSYGNQVSSSTVFLMIYSREGVCARRN